MAKTGVSQSVIYILVILRPFAKSISSHFLSFVLEKLCKTLAASVYASPFGHPSSAPPAQNKTKMEDEDLPIAKWLNPRVPHPPSSSKIFQDLLHRIPPSLDPSLPSTTATSLSPPPPSHSRRHSIPFNQNTLHLHNAISSTQIATNSHPPRHFQPPNSSLQVHIDCNEDKSELLSLATALNNPSQSDPSLFSPFSESQLEKEMEQSIEHLTIALQFWAFSLQKKTIKAWYIATMNRLHIFHVKKKQFQKRRELRTLSHIFKTWKMKKKEYQFLFDALDFWAINHQKTFFIRWKRHALHMAPKTRIVGRNHLKYLLLFWRVEFPLFSARGDGVRYPFFAFLRSGQSIKNC